MSLAIAIVSPCSAVYTALCTTQPVCNLNASIGDKTGEENLNLRGPLESVANTSLRQEKPMKKLILHTIAMCLMATCALGHAERVEITLSDASTLGVYLLIPEIRSAAAFPLVILMGGGAGDEGIARDVQGGVGQDLVDRGWVVATPVSPNGRSFRGDNNRLIPLLIDALQKDERISKGRTLLAGISNGGMSALEIAAATPQDYAGIMAVPALVPRGLNLRALADMPIYLRIGDQDEAGWQDRLDETATALRAAGAQVDAGLVFMSPHMFAMEWETLDPWLQTILPATTGN
jgi:predicted esterase